MNKPAAVQSAPAHVGVQAKKALRNLDGDAAGRRQDARRVLAEEKLEAYIDKIVAQAPPLGPEARARIAALLMARPDERRRRGLLGRLRSPRG